MKEFAIFALFGVLLLEAYRAAAWLMARRRTHAARPGARVLLRPLAAVAFAAAGFFSLLALMDAVVVPFNSGHRVDTGQASICHYTLVWQGACNHFSFMNVYAQRLRSTGPPQGIASYPWQFWLNTRAIDYYTATRAVRAGNVVTSIDTIVKFQGLINPLVLGTGWIGLLLCAFSAARSRDDLAFFAVAWVIATWLPEEIFSLVSQRTTYLYYMVVTMPAIYVAVARLLGNRLLPRWAVGMWVGIVLSLFVVLYPFRTLTGT